MRILITGGAGYVGNELTFELLKHPKVDEILIYDNLSRKNYNLFLDTKYPAGKVKFVKGQLLDSRKLRSILDGVDIVYHLAAIVSTPFADADSHLFEQINNWGTAELVYAVEESNVKKFIYLSTTSVYGAPDKEIDINTPPAGSSFYGISKLRGEAHVERLAEKIPSYIFRCANIYGYSPSVRFDAVINRFMFEANYSGRIQVNGNGNQSRAFIHVDEAVNVLCNLILKDFPSGTYNLVTRNHTILEIAELVKKIYPSLDVIFVNQHMKMRQLRVLPDKRVEPVLTMKINPLMEQLLAFKEKFSFSSFNSLH